MAGGALCAVYAVTNLITGRMFFLAQNALLAAGFGTSAVLSARRRTEEAINYGFLPSIAVLLSFQTASLFVLDRPFSAFVYVPFVFLLVLQLAATFASRLHQILIPLGLTLLATGAALFRFRLLLAENIVPATGLLVVFLFCASLTLIGYQSGRRADREMRLRDDLVREVHHRVKNETMMLVSLIDDEIVLAKDPATIAALRRDRQRILAVLSTHRHLQNNADRQLLPLDDYLADVIRPFSGDLAPGAPPVQIATEPSHLEMPGSDAMTIGLIVNELLANAVKHGERDQRIRVGVTPGKPTGVVPGRPAGVVVAVCNAVASVDAQPNRVQDDSGGFGLEFVERLAQMMGGTLSIDQGEEFAVTVRLPQVRVALTTREERSTL